MKDEGLTGDALLRAHGYRVWERPEGGEPVWRDREGYLVKETFALQRVRRLRGGLG